MVQTKIQRYDSIFASKNISRSAKNLDEKKNEEDEQTLADLSPAHLRSQAKMSASTKQLHSHELAK